MKKLFLTLFLFLFITLNVNARPQIEIKNGGNCSEFVYQKILTKYKIDLPIKNNTQQEWLSLKNKIVKGNNKKYKIRFSNIPKKNSLQLLTCEYYSQLWEEKSYSGHIRFVEQITYNKYEDNYCLWTEESSLDTFENIENCDKLNGIWFQYNFYTYTENKNIFYIWFQEK